MGSSLTRSTMACSVLPAGGSAAAWRGGWAASRPEAAVATTPALKSRAEAQARRRMCAGSMGSGTPGARRIGATLSYCRPRSAVPTFAHDNHGAGVARAESCRTHGGWGDDQRWTMGDGEYVGAFAGQCVLTAWVPGSGPQTCG